MPTPTVTDVQDRFTELFGNKRGAGRPEGDIIATPNSQLGEPCAGGCGARVMPVGSEDWGAQAGPWYCGVCFAAEKRKIEVGGTSPAAPRNVPTAPTFDEIFSGPSRKKSILGFTILGLLFAAILYFGVTSLAQIETGGQWDSRVQTAIAAYLRITHPHAADVKCQAGFPYSKPRCLFSEGSGAEKLAVFAVGQHEEGFKTRLTSVRITSIHPYVPIPAFSPSISGETQQQYEEHKGELLRHEQETT